MSAIEEYPEVVRNIDGEITIVFDFDYSLNDFYRVVIDCLDETELS